VDGNWRVGVGGGGGGSGSTGIDTGGMINLLALKVGKKTCGDSEKLDFASMLLLLLVSSSSWTSKMGGLLARLLLRSQMPSRIKNKMIKRQPIKETIPTSTDCGVLSAGSAVVDDIVVVYVVLDCWAPVAGAVEGEVKGKIVDDWVFGDWEETIDDSVDLELVKVVTLVVVVPSVVPVDCCDVADGAGAVVDEVGGKMVVGNGWVFEDSFVVVAVDSEFTVVVVTLALVVELFGSTSGGEVEPVGTADEVEDDCSPG